jgi:hypothetical protein
MIGEDRSGYIRVISNVDTPKGVIIGRFDGKDYHFKKGVPLDVPEAVARHVFDFGKEDKSQALARLGWLRTSDEYDAAMEKMNLIKFDDPPELIEAPPKPRSRRLKGDETGTAGPPVNAGGTEGGDFKSPPNGPKIGQEAGEDDDAE